MTAKIFFLLFFSSFFLSQACLPIRARAQDTVSSSQGAYNEDVYLQDTIRVNILNKIASDYLYKNFFLAEKYGRQSLELSKRINFKPGMIAAYNVIGLSSLNQLKFPESIESFIKALKLVDASGDLIERARILNNIGSFYNSQKDYVKALDYYKQSAKLYTQQKKESRLLVLNVNISNCYMNLGAFPTALRIAEEGLRKAQKENEQIDLAKWYLTIAQINLKVGKNDNALLYFRKSLNIFEMLEDGDSKMEILEGIGKVYLSENKPDEARKYFANVLALCAASENREVEYKTYKNLSTVDSIKGDFIGALSFYKKYAVMKDSLLNINKDIKVKNIQAAYDLEKKEKSIEFLMREKARQNEELKNKNIEVIIISSSFVLIVILCAFLYFFYRQKREGVIKLQKQKQELQMLNSVKDRLFSVISHDLRSPLANLEAILNLMETGDLSIDEVVMLAGQLTQNVQDTSNMLDNLLQWSKSQMQGIKPKYDRVNMGEIVNEVIYFFRQQAEKKAISIRSFVGEPSTTFTDAEMIKLVVRNLLANAIKFTPTGGMINVEVKSTLHDIIVSIKDSGLGISDKNKEKLFANDSFSTKGTQNEKGTGLGLLLCKEFVEKNNGKIWLESQIGKGSTFSFSLPMVVEPAADKNIIRSKFI